MLDAYIIDELRRREREEERRQDEALPRLEIPLAPPDLPFEPKDKDEEKPARGVVIVDYTIGTMSEPLGLNLPGECLDFPHP